MQMQIGQEIRRQKSQPQNRLFSQTEQQSLGLQNARHLLRNHFVRLNILSLLKR